MTAQPSGKPAGAAQADGLASMTGFGQACSEADGLRIVVEARSINNRHLKLSFRADAGCGVLEPQVEALVRRRLHRGAVQLGLKVTRAVTGDAYRLNRETLDGYREQLLAAGLITPDDRSGPPPAELVAGLLGLPGVVEETDSSQNDPRELWPLIEPVVAEAVETLHAMRREEGAALAADLLNNCRRVTDELAGIEARAPAVVAGYRTRLVERVGQALSELNVSVEPADLVREVAVYADRSDISEEIVRLRSHIEQFTAAVNGADGGRKLEFIAQEMGRETNTIGSKANDGEISQRVVEIKTALERIREQVQNVE